jgi:hypothetical protein
MRPVLSFVVVSLLTAGCNVQVGSNGVSFGLGNGRARDEWTRTYSLPERGRLEIVNVTGGIEAAAGEGRDVEVRAEREARAGSDEDARQLLESVRMREEVSPDSVRIQAETEGLGRGRRTVAVSYRVRVPAGLVVVLKTENGGIRLQNVSGEITAETTNGGINARAISGAVSASVVNGGIELELSAVTGGIAASSVNGGVRIDVPRDLGASLEVSCVNGGISVDDALALQVSESSRRRVVGTINGGGPSITANTVNGGIRIRATGSADSGG